MSEPPRYWFPAKRYGWGWAAPCTWQGWIVLLTYLMLVLCAPFVFDPNTHIVGHLLFVGVVTVLLLVICWRKGEPPRWRWGDP